MAAKNKFRKIALSTVCIFSLLTNSANAFTAADYFNAAQNGNLDQLQNFVAESNRMIAAAGGDYKLNLDIADESGNTAAMKAAAFGQLHVLDYLARSGANLSLQNPRGETAYSMAVLNNQAQAANYIHAYFEAQNAAITASAARTPVAAPASVQTTSTSASTGGISGSWLMGAGLIAGIGAGIAAASAGGGGGGGGGGSTAFAYTPDPTQDGITDTGGATGAGDTHPDANNEAGFLTAESIAQEGYLEMNTQYAHAKGYDGRIFVRNASNGLLVNDTADDNIVVAVIDTGVDLDHVDLNDNLLLSLDVSCTTAGCSTVTGGNDDSGTGHGTKVAGIIAAEKDGGGGTNMHGIAPEAKIIPIRAIGIANGSDILGIQYAVDNNANVINASYGLEDGSGEIPIVTATGQLTTPYTPAELASLLATEEGGVSYYDAFQDMVVNDTIIVYAAGNDGMDETGVLAGLPYYFQGSDPGGITGYTTVNPNLYNWKTNWVAVVSVDDNNDISTFSNECGVAKDWCLAAPGEIAVSTTNDGGYASNIQGTSFAAPNISGAIAIMLGAFPHLTPQEALEIIFDTATDLGTAGVDDVYGHGLVNLNDATNPSLGGWNILTGPSAASAGFALAESRLRLSAPFGDGLKSLSSKQLIFLDAHKKDYAINASSLFASNVVNEDRLVTMQKFGESQIPALTKVGGLNLGITTSAKFSEGSAESKMHGGNETTLGKMLVSTEIPFMKNVVKAMYSANTNLADIEAENSASSFTDNSLSGSFKNQYLAFSDEAQSFSIGFGGKELGAKLGYYFSDADTQFEDNNSLDIRGFYSSVNYLPAKNHALNIQSGVNIEQGSFMGSEAIGALSIADETKTYFNKISYAHNITDNLSFMGNYGFGVTNLNSAQSSLVKDLSDAYSDSFALGLEYNDAASSDSFGLALSQPLRVRSANANISLPIDVLGGGVMVYDNFNTSVAPSGRELDLEGYYSTRFDNESKILFGAMLRTEPNNVQDAQSELLLLTKYNVNF